MFILQIFTATLPFMSKPKIVAIVGATSSGKTSLSIEIAKQFAGEVISADSRQVYQGLDLGTGKVTPEEMDGVSHHLLDVVPATSLYTASDFKRDAEEAIGGILERSHLPILAGGTFFYLDVLRGTMQTAPVAPNPQLRIELEKLSDTELLEQLKEKDPARAELIDPDNRRRLIRSLEIIAELGTVPQVHKADSPYDWLIIGLDIEKEVLHKNIHHRLHERINSGMIQEVRGLLASGVTTERLEQLGLEYRYISRFLNQELTESEMVDTLETKNRQLAKRQLTWLKRDKAIEWFAPQNREAILGRISTFLETKTS